jgi:tRNA-splicing ligase RtcB (3'-phosphate/5'-hydroxy nucleic acid ligase)
MSKTKKITENIYTVEKYGSMNVPVKIFASQKLISKMEQDKCINQGINVAALPGIKGASLMMPDAHQGYGFSIGGVAALDEHDGCISPGGVGFDINCGMRVMTTNLKYEQIKEKIDELLDGIYQKIPVGVGKDSDIRLTHEELDEVLKNGAAWAVEKGFGKKSDLLVTEENGYMSDADPTKVSPRAKKRGKAQLGTLGAGNHFIEIQCVENILDEATAKTFGFTEKDQVVVMIHSGSRGLGHQVCTDYLRRIEEEYPELVAALPEKDLAYAPIKSDLAQDYYKAMCCAMNFAWANRQIMMVRVKEAFLEVFKEAELNLLYDMSHNNAKKENHIIDGEKQNVWVHRKGAARAFGPDSPDIPDQYKKTGQPVLIPGSMGTASYILAGTKKAMTETFGTTCHGAGRLMSRKAASQKFTVDEVEHELEAQGIHIKAGSKRGIVNEAPKVYKDVDEVVRVCHETGIAKLVVKLRPLGVIKG